MLSALRMGHACESKAGRLLVALRSSLEQLAIPMLDMLTTRR